MPIIRDMAQGKKPMTDVGYSPLTQAHKDRRMLFDAYWAYYRGNHKKPLRVEAGAADDNVILNMSKRVVNKGVQFLFGKAVDFEIDSETDERTAEEEYLDEVWGTDEQKHTMLQKVALNGAITGTAVVRLYAPEAGELPLMVNINPAMLDVVTLEDDVDQVVSYRLVWKSGDLWKRHRIDLMDNDTWYITVETTRPGSPEWNEVAGESGPWPYVFAPIVTCQNLPIPNTFWGMSDLEDADINDSINFTASNINRILRFHAHPKTIGTGMAADEVQTTAIDDFWTVNNEQAKVFNLEMQSDLASAYNYLNMLKGMYAKVSGVPELDPAQVNVGALSGFALKILYGDLLETTQTKRNTYGALLSEINTRVLALAGLGEYGTVQVRNVWESPLPDNDLEEAQTLEIDRRNGLSEETYLTRRGYDAEQEQEKKDEEQEAQSNVGAELLRQFEAGGRGGQQFAQPERTSNENGETD